MTKAELAKVVHAAKCRVIGWEDAGNAGHRRVMAVLIEAFNNTESAVLCEPSLARKTHRPPDLVLIDPEIGVHVFEIKAVELSQIESLEAGGQLRIRYSSGVRSRSPIVQVRNAMFDIKDATVRAFGGDVRLPFRYWVVFPSMRKAEWIARFGKEAFCPKEFLFSDDLISSQLVSHLGASDRNHSTEPINLCPLDQLECVWRAFGDSSVLYCQPEDRESRHTNEGTLGEVFDESAEAYKNLSDEQQKLSAMNWEGGPRQVRGVAGSGKTVVLANNLARFLERRLMAATETLFVPPPPRPRVLAVCFNRTLAPFIEKKINIAFKQRTGHDVPEGAVEVCSFNTLMYRMGKAGLWKYRSVEDAADIVRALRYVEDLENVKAQRPAQFWSHTYDAVYVDEGQDFLEDEFRLLLGLCRVPKDGEPNLYVFYDDAQNLFGRSRPNWQSLGINVRGGRSFVMTQCFRNTQPIVEASFNVLYGSCAPANAQVPTKDYGDIATLEQKGLIRSDGGFWRIGFAKRTGTKPLFNLANNLRHETDLLLSRIKWLVEEQQVRLQDILVLSFGRRRIRELAESITAARIASIPGVHVAFHDKDRPLLGQKDRLTLSTVASAKGYDAHCVLLASANEFPTDVIGRANFYVGCTRAIEHLEVFAYEGKGLATELEAVLGRI